LLQIKQVFTEENLPRVIFQEDSQMFTTGDCSMYGVYNGRSREEDKDKIYVNKDVRSKFSVDLRDRVVSYSVSTI